jgi:predicted nucleic acid-binding protein
MLKYLLDTKVISERFVDGQIAAVAATNDLILVTFNPTDYAAFRDLRIEDWRNR